MEKIHLPGHLNEASVATEEGVARRLPGTG